MENDIISLENNIGSLRFLTLREVAAMLQISQRSVQRLIQRKELPALKVGGQWRVRGNELAKRLQDLNELSRFVS